MSFTADEDAAIGCLVRALGELEYVLGGLFMTLREARHGEKLDDPESGESKELQNILGFSIGQYVSPLEKEAEALDCDAKRSLRSFSGSLKELGEIRNIICHGVWRREPSGDICVSFWSRSALGALRKDRVVEPEQLHMNLQRINALSETVTQHSSEIRLWRQSIQDRLRQVD